MEGKNEGGMLPVTAVETPGQNAGGNLPVMVVETLGQNEGETLHVPAEQRQGENEAMVVEHGGKLMMRDRATTCQCLLGPE